MPPETEKARKNTRMLYQKILTEEKPYQLILGRMSGFTEHRHADLELNFCVHGSFDVIVDKECYHVSEGELSMIAPGVSHAFPHSEQSDRRVLTVILGTSLLKKHFERFANCSFSHPVCRLSDVPHRQMLLEALQNMVTLYDERTEKSELLLTAELYRVCACLLDEMPSPIEADVKKATDLRAVANIERALELIYYDYRKMLTVEDAAEVTGYGKSNFCKIFKRITGATFHQALNHRRVRVACGLLTETDLSVAEIAAEVGFTEAKTFCRVFKEIENATPGEYRRARLS